MVMKFYHQEKYWGVNISKITLLPDIIISIFLLEYTVKIVSFSPCDVTQKVVKIKIMVENSHVHHPNLLWQLIGERLFFKKDIL